MSDKVNHPKHYNSHPSKIECIEIVQHHNFNIGNAIKYLWRQGLKDNEPNIQDLEKAVNYIKFEIERIRNFPVLNESFLGCPICLEIGLENAKTCTSDHK